jgi:hypothetical protein
VGCGKGRATCCASTYLLKKVIALDVNQSLVDTAIDNASRMRRRKSKVIGLVSDATQFNYDDVTVIYMYNPFGRDTMESMMCRVAESYARNPRPLKIAYANNLHEEPLFAQSWLKKKTEWEKNKFKGFGCPISFWSSK